MNNNYSFRELNEEFELRPIKSDDHYEEALTISGRLGNIKKPTEDICDYRDVLDMLLNDYENEMGFV